MYCDREQEGVGGKGKKKRRERATEKERGSLMQ